MRLNESENAEVVDISEIPLDYDAIQYDVQVTKPEITLYFDKSGTISDVDTIEMQVLASSALPKKVYIGVEYDPVEYDTKFSLDSLTDDVYEIEETDSGYSLTTDNLDGLVDLGFSASFERGIIWPFDNSSVHDQLNKALGRIKSFEGKIIYYVTGQIPGAIQKKNPIPGIELTDGFKTAQKEWLKDASAKQEIRRIRQGRTNLEMLVDAIKKYPNVEKVQMINKNAGRDYTKEVMIVATVNRWNPRQKKRIPERTIMILRSNNAGTHMYAYNKAQAFNGYEARSWELMNKWLKNALQIAYTKDETDVKDDWGKDIDSAEAASLGIEESTKSKKKGMNLYEASNILKKQGLKLRKLNEVSDSVAIKFSVFLKGEDFKDERVECTIRRPYEEASKIAWNGENYDDDANERFCYKVPDIVYNLTGEHCSRNWCFDDGPEIQQ